MYQVLRTLHVIGWAGWFGIAIAEAVIGAQLRKADAKQRPALAKVLLRVGGIELGFMTMAVVFGLATFFVLAQMGSLGMAAFMKQKSNIYLPVMLGLGLIAGLLSLIAHQARGKAAEAIEKNDEAGFGAAYKRAAMLGGMSNLLIFIVILEVLLRAVGF